MRGGEPRIRVSALSLSCAESGGAGIAERIHWAALRGSSSSINPSERPPNVKSDVSSSVVVGPPIQLPKVEVPTREDIAKWHGKYMEARHGAQCATYHVPCPVAAVPQQAQLTRCRHSRGRVPCCAAGDDGALTPPALPLRRSSKPYSTEGRGSLGAQGRSWRCGEAFNMTRGMKCSAA